MELVKTLCMNISRMLCIKISLSLHLIFYEFSEAPLFMVSYTLVRKTIRQLMTFYSISLATQNCFRFAMVLSFPQHSCHSQNSSLYNPSKQALFCLNVGSNKRSFLPHVLAWLCSTYSNFFSCRCCTRFFCEDVLGHFQLDITTLGWIPFTSLIGNTQTHHFFFPLAISMWGCQAVQGSSLLLCLDPFIRILLSLQWDGTGVNENIPLYYIEGTV